MNIQTFLIIIILSFCSCSNSVKNDNVIIKPEYDTIEVDDLYRAELYVNYMDSVLPKFYFFYEDEIFLIPFDEDLDCGVFQAIGRKVGKTIYKCEVDYFSTEGIKKKESFQIEFYVKDSIPR